MYRYRLNIYRNSSSMISLTADDFEELKKKIGQSKEELLPQIINFVCLHLPYEFEDKDIILEFLKKIDGRFPGFSFVFDTVFTESSLPEYEITLRVSDFVRNWQKKYSKLQSFLSKEKWFFKKESMIRKYRNLNEDVSKDIEKIMFFSILENLTIDMFILTVMMNRDRYLLTKRTIEDISSCIPYKGRIRAGYILPDFPPLRGKISFP